MLSSRAWSTPTIWLGVVAIAMICALIVIELAFQSSALAFSAEPSRLTADYSADPHDARMLVIAPVEAAVITDTLRDLAIERPSSTPEATPAPTNQPASDRPATAPTRAMPACWSSRPSRPR